MSKEVGQVAVQNTVDLSIDRTGRVLIVEDDKKSRILLCDLLRARGHEVIEASNGQEAIQKAGDSEPDVVLLDIMLPGIDGFEVCRKLKEAPQTRPVPIILVTALTDRDARLKGIDAGANDFLVKPIDSRDVALRVRNAIQMRSLYKELGHSYEKLREVENLRDDLMHLVVHDMKTPLGGISGYLELLEMQAKEKLTDEEIGFLDEARDATRRLLDMTVVLLDVSRLEENQLPLKKQWRNMRELAEEAGRHVSLPARQKAVRMSFPAEDVMVYCDPVIIRRVLVNLIENAIKFVPEEGQVSVEVEDCGASKKILVRDNGPGIPPEYHQKVFEKFGQVDLRAEKKLYSTGLGLAFCKLAVEAHGGTIGLQSAQGQGTTIEFSLPAGKPDVAEGSDAA